MQIFVLLFASVISLWCVGCLPVNAQASRKENAATKDWCSQVSEADAALGSSPGIITVSGPGGQPCTAAPTLGDYHSLRFEKPGIYQISTGWTITSKHDLAIMCMPGTVLSFIGNEGFMIDGSMVMGGSRRIHIDGCIFSGNSSVANAVTLNKVVESTFTDLTGMNAVDVAILCKGCLANTFIRPASSTHNKLGPNPHVVVPRAGLQLDTNGPIPSNVNTIVGPVFEGLSRGVGISCVSGRGNVIIGGTSEANAIGISLSKDCIETQVIGIDLEANSDADIRDDGPRNSFLNVTAYSGPQALIEVNAGAAQTKFFGGTFHTITIAPGANGTTMSGVTYSGAGKGGAINDASNNTVKLNIRNLYTGAFDQTTLGSSGIVVGSSPFSSLPKSPDGSMIYCSDCNASCSAGGGHGRVCFHENGGWAR